jgi:hypothetical protein
MRLFDRRLLIAASVVFSACSTHQNADVGPPDRGVSIDAQAADAHLADGEALDGSSPDAEGMDAAAGCPCTLVEDFKDTTLVDPALTTATIDTSSSGFARATAPLTLTSTASGREGAFAPAASMALSAGVHDFSSIDINAVSVTSPGDLTLLVTGPIHLHGRGALLNVSGSLTIIAGDLVQIDDGCISATGNITLHQIGSQGIIVSGPSSMNGEIFTKSPTGAGGSGSIQVWTRGSLQLGANGYLTTGRTNDPNGRSGTIEVRAYGDVLVGPHDAYFISGDSLGTNGGIYVYTEGRLVLDNNSYLIAGRGNTTQSAKGDIIVRAKGTVELNNGSYFISAPGGTIDVNTEQSLTVQDGSYFITGSMGAPSAVPPPITVRARSFKLAPGMAAGTDSYLQSTSPGDIDVDLLEDAVMTGASGLNAGNGTCKPGGNIRMRAQGSIQVLGASQITGGKSTANVGCAPQHGGNVDLIAGMTVTTSVAGNIIAGTGTPTGAVSIMSHAGYLFGDLDAHLTSSSSVTSIAIHRGSQSLIGFRLFATLPPLFSGARLLLSPAGTLQDLLPAEDLVGKPLPDGFKYRVLLESRMFDGTSLDGFAITYQ